MLTLLIFDASTMFSFRASKEFGIPNSTLYKIARKEGIKLSSPFSAIQPSWNPEDLNRALDAIRGGMSVQKSAQEFGIPTGTLYGRCRREGIELSKYQVCTVNLEMFHMPHEVCKIEYTVILWKILMFVVVLPFSLGSPMV